MQKRITKRSVDAIEANPTGDVFVWDTELKGFGVRVKPSGATAFLLSYYAPGLHRVRRRLTIGVYGPMTVDQAREEAKRQLGAIADGADPAKEEAEGRRAAKEETIAKLFAIYLDEQVGHRKPRTLAFYEDLGERYIIPFLGKLPIRKLTARHVAEVHRELGDKKVTANRVARLVRGFWNWCAKRELVDRGSKNPASSIDWYPEQGRERFLTPEEMARLGQALRTAEEIGLPPAPEFRKQKEKKEKEKPPRTKRARNAGMFSDELRPASPIAVAALRFLAFSGWREQEALTLQWDHVDFGRSLATLPDTKTGKSVRVISAPALEILAAQLRVQGSPYVFPGRNPTKPLTEFTRLWYAVRWEAKLDGVRLHDLRHSLAATAAGRGLSLLIIQRLLGHKDARSTLRYAHVADDVRKLAADDVGEVIRAALSAETLPTPITPLKAVS